MATSTSTTSGASGLLWLWITLGTVVFVVIIAIVYASYNRRRQIAARNIALTRSAVVTDYQIAQRQNEAETLVARRAAIDALNAARANPV